MKKIKILILIPCFLLLANKYNNSKIESYLYQESFEKKNPIEFWTKSVNLSKFDVKYKLDKKNFSTGNSSLLIDINVTAYNNWYYYMKIPLKEKPNLEGNLSFSMDINIDKKSAKYLQIGLNLDSYPVTNATYIFKKISKFNKWISIKSENLKKTTKEHAKKQVGYMFNGELDAIGRRVNFIGFLLRGKGNKHIKFHIDNIKIEGTQIENGEFIRNTRDAWNRYKIKAEIDFSKIKKFIKKLPNIKKNKLSLTEQQRYKLGKKYIDKIDLIVKEIDNNKQPYIKSKKIKELNKTINYYIDNYKSLRNKENITVYKFPALKYYRLNGYNTPKLKEAKLYKLRMTAGEYKSIALLMKVNHNFETYTASSSNFIGDKNSFSKDNLDLYIAKIWYQAGLSNTHRTGKFLTQELLLKDESLIKVDFEKKINYLKITKNNSQKKEYIEISNPKKPFPKTDLISFDDSQKLKPFKLDSIRHKLLWGIIHIPPNTESGIYKSSIKIKNSEGKIKKEIKIEIEVLPFILNKSKLIYSLYYHGKLDKDAMPIYTYKKTAKQLEIELKDIKEHGVLYPNSYDIQAEKLDKVLSIRDKLGFPKDRFYSLGIYTYSSNIKKRIKEFKKVLNKHGYNSNNLYIYAEDEAKESKLKKERKRIKIAKDSGAKVFVAGYDYTYKYIGDRLDLLIYAGGAIDRYSEKQVKNWHKSKHEIFAYASPQVGVENPEIYRRNFGCKLWKNGFDGAMDYAYQKQYGDFWNDFDSSGSLYREEAFTYPTHNGIIGTIEWEGYREAITDVRYISTLENLRDKLQARGEDTSKLDLWLKRIDCNSDLDKLRQEIITKILSIYKYL